MANFRDSDGKMDQQPIGSTRRMRVGPVTTSPPVVDVDQISSPAKPTPWTRASTREPPNRRPSTSPVPVVMSRTRKEGPLRRETPTASARQMCQSQPERTVAERVKFDSDSQDVLTRTTADAAACVNDDGVERPFFAAVGGVKTRRSTGKFSSKQVVNLEESPRPLRSAQLSIKQKQPVRRVRKQQEISPSHPQSSTFNAEIVAHNRCRRSLPSKRPQGAVTIDLESVYPDSYTTAASPPPVLAASPIPAVPDAKKGAVPRRSRRQLERNNANSTPTLHQEEAARELVDLEISSGNTPYTGSTDLIFVYPPGVRGSVRVTAEERERLSQRKYLNDSLIDFYIKYLETCLLTQPKQLHESRTFFSSFFFGRMSQMKSAQAKEPKIRMIDYKGVAKWTKNIEIFTQKYVFVPICDSYHWSLIIVINLNNLEDALGKKDLSEDKSPKIVYLDSLDPERGNNFGLKMCQYLTEEWITRKDGMEKIPSNVRKEKLAQFKTILKVLKPHIPIQSNEYDCGLYVLQCLQMFLQNTNSFQEKLSMGVMNMKNAFTHTDIEMLRRNILMLMNNLSASWKWKTSALNHTNEIDIKTETRAKEPTPVKKYIPDDTDDRNNVRNVKEANNIIPQQSNSPGHDCIVETDKESMADKSHQKNILVLDANSTGIECENEDDAKVNLQSIIDHQAESDDMEVERRQPTVNLVERSIEETPNELDSDIQDVNAASPRVMMESSGDDDCVAAMDVDGEPSKTHRKRLAVRSEGDVRGGRRRRCDSEVSGSIEGGSSLGGFEVRDGNDSVEVVTECAPSCVWDTDQVGRSGLESDGGNESEVKFAPTGVESVLLNITGIDQHRGVQNYIAMDEVQSPGSEDEKVVALDGQSDLVSGDRQHLGQLQRPIGSGFGGNRYTNHISRSLHHVETIDSVADSAPKSDRSSGHSQSEDGHPVLEAGQPLSFSYGEKNIISDIDG